MSETIIKITEDVVSASELGDGDGVIGAIIKVKSGTPEVLLKKLHKVRTEAEFGDLFDSTTVTETELSVIYAKYLLRMGCPLLLGLVPDDGTLSYTSVQELFQNREYSFSFIVDLIDLDPANTLSHLAQIVTAREGDCQIVISSESASTARSLQTTFRATYESFSYTIDGSVITLNILDYTAHLAPASIVYSERIVPRSLSVPGFTDTLATIPTAIPFLVLLSRQFQNKMWWKAPAGIEQGVLPDVVDLTEDLSLSDTHASQRAGILPVLNKASVGAVVWGNTTLAGYTTFTGEAIEDLSVRLLTNYFKQMAYQISQGFMFREHTEATWNDWKNLVDPKIRAVYNAGGIRDYRVVMDRTIMTESDILKGILKGQITFWPVKAITEIRITFSIDKSGVTFE